MSKPAVSFRIDEDIHDRIQERARENGETKTEIVRSLLEMEFKDEDVPVNIVGEFHADITSTWATDTDDGLRRSSSNAIYSPLDGETKHRAPLSDSVLRRFDEDIRHFTAGPNNSSTDIPVTSELRRVLFEDAETVYVAAHGSSLSIARWLASRLRTKGIKARAAAAVRTANRPITADDAVVVVSRSGETDTLLTLADRVPEGTSRIAVTQAGTSLTNVTDYTVYVPEINEHVEEYASRSLLAQVLSVLEFIFDELPDYSTLVRWSVALDAFVSAQFQSDRERLREESSFAAVARTMENHGDLTADPILTGAGTDYTYGKEFQLKLTEFLHANATREHVSTLRDGLVNVLFREEAYLLTFLPPTWEEGARNEWRSHLLDGEESIRGLLEGTTTPGAAPELRLIVLGFDSPDAALPAAVQRESFYGEHGYIALDGPAFDVLGVSDSSEVPRAFLDLYAFTAVYTFVYAMLERRWRHDRDLQKTVINRVYDPQKGGDA